MTKPQIWVAAFLVLFIALFLLQRATKQDESASKNAPMNTVPQTSMSSTNISAKELISRLGCVNCHGTDLTGTMRGPSLIGVSQFWSRDQLINYLRNPNSFMNSDRFKDYKIKYPNELMPSFNNIDVKDLGKIAEYLLKLE